LWRERYRVLFGENVAGAILTTPEGRIVDCNEACARIFGFESRDDMLAYSAWDFYFNRAEREILIDRLRAPGNNPAEEVCLRARDGAPIWVIARRTVASYVDGVPELLQGTFIDITAQKKAQAPFGGISEATSSAGRREGEKVETAALSQRLAALLQRASQAIQPENLAQMGRAEIQEFLLILEETKMLMSELEVLRLFRK
jgi:PAS domain S-box-containing protein